MNQAGRAEAKRIFLTPVGLYIFVHPVVFLVHDPYNHVGWFFALQKASLKKIMTPPPLGDVFMLLTIHIHCFYAYALRLALSQYKGILALWKIFIGKKYNPLRDRVDSADCTVEQLFLGTIIFTILLFLFPTTLTFFLVFFTLKSIVKLISCILKSIILLLHWLPNNELR